MTWLQFSDNVKNRSGNAKAIPRLIGMLVSSAIRIIWPHVHSSHLGLDRPLNPQESPRWGITETCRSCGHLTVRVTSYSFSDRRDPLLSAATLSISPACGGTRGSNAD